MTTPLTKKDSSQPQPSKARKEQAPRVQGSPESGEWECPECKTRYICNVGTCGNNLDCSRPNVVPVQRTEPRGQQQEDLRTAEQKRYYRGVDLRIEERLPSDVYDGLNCFRRITVNEMPGHKAELAAERQESKHLRDSINGLQSSLAAERQRCDQAERDRDYLRHQTITCGIIAEGNEHLNRNYQAGGKWDSQQAEKVRSLHQQLLSALAAIEKHNNLHKLDYPKHTINDIDLSALHEHDAEVEQKVLAKACSMISERNERDANRDAEVREPLVGALERLLDTSKECDGSFPTEAHLNARRAAVKLLAKVKEGNKI